MTDFLLNTGTSGFIVSPFDLQTTELNALANNGTAISSVGGSSGVFSQTSIGSAPQAALWFKSGGAFTPSAGGYIAGWFIRSIDGGTTFERVSSGNAQPRPPDFVVPLFASAYASNDIAWCSGGFISTPWESFKVAVQNVSGVTLPATGNTVRIGPVVLKY